MVDNIKITHGAWGKDDQYLRIVMDLGKRMNSKAIGPEKRIDYRPLVNLTGKSRKVYEELYGTKSSIK